jgi:hypothetical protein
LNNIGSLCYKLNRHEEALDKYLKYLEINRKIFGTDEHSSNADNFNNISSVFMELGKNEEDHGKR